MVSLNSKERKMVKFIKEKNGASEEELKKKFGKNYIKILNSLSAKNIVYQALAEGQPFFDHDSPPGCIFPSIPNGDYMVVDNVDEMTKNTSHKGNNAQIIIGLITAVITLVAAFIGIFQLFLK